MHTSPVVAVTASIREGEQPRRVRLNAAYLTALENAGLSPAEIVRAADSLVDFVHGFSLGEASNPSGTFDIGPELLARLESRPVDEVPALRRVFGALGEEGARYDFDAAFEAGLDILVGGIEAVAGDRFRPGRTGPGQDDRGRAGSGA